MAEQKCKDCSHENPPAALFCEHCGKPLYAAARDPLVGQTIAGRYYIIERLGQGSAGVLYRAEHVTLRRRMAIKLLHKHLAQSDEAVERFRREAITVCEIDNDHIPQVHDFGRADDGRLFFAMEFLEGEPLSQTLAREGRISIERTIDIIEQAADGLMEAHTLGYVHRDLRPRSIFLSRRRSRPDFVRILDFGLAKLVNPEADAQRTTLGMTYGDPRYMAPEQARGEALDRRADIYSLGAIAFESLTGEPPYVDEDAVQILSKILDAPVPRVRDRRPDCPAWLESIVRVALSKLPSERFQTVTQLLDALERKQVLKTQPPMPGSSKAPVLKPAAQGLAIRQTLAYPAVAPNAPKLASAPVSKAESPLEPRVGPRVAMPIATAAAAPSTEIKAAAPPKSAPPEEKAVPPSAPASTAAPSPNAPTDVAAAVSGPNFPPGKSATPPRSDPTPRTVSALLEEQAQDWLETVQTHVSEEKPTRLVVAPKEPDPPPPKDLDTTLPTPKVTPLAAEDVTRPQMKRNDSAATPDDQATAIWFAADAANNDEDFADDVDEHTLYTVSPQRYIRWAGAAVAVLGVLVICWLALRGPAHSPPASSSASNSLAEMTTAPSTNSSSPVSPKPADAGLAPNPAPAAAPGALAAAKDASMQPLFQAVPDLAKPPAAPPVSAPPLAKPLLDAPKPSAPSLVAPAATTPVSAAKTATEPPKPGVSATAKPISAAAVAESAKTAPKEEPAATAEVAANPKTSEVASLISLGKKRLEDGEPDAAMQSFARALELDPHSGEAAGGLGEAAFEQGDFEEAVRQLEKAVRMAPRKSRYQEFLASAQFKLGRYSDAAETSRRILKQDPASKRAKQTLEQAEKKLSSP